MANLIAANVHYRIQEKNGTQGIPVYRIPSFNNCAKFLQHEPKFMCSGQAANATNYTATVMVAASNNDDDSSSMDSGLDSKLEKYAGDISENNQNKKQKVTGLNTSACHVQCPKGKHQVANGKLTKWSSQ